MRRRCSHPCPRGQVILATVPSATLPSLLVPLPTPLLSMQVALLRGQSQLKPVQPGSHAHWPMEQRPRSAESGEGEERRATFTPAVHAAHLPGRACGCSA